MKQETISLQPTYHECRHRTNRLSRMDEARKAIRFTLIRESRNLYVFSLDDGTDVQFADQHRAWNREFEVVSGSSHFRLSSKGFSPPITLESHKGLVLQGTNSIGSMCFSWTSANREYQLIGRHPCWLVFASQAFHLHWNGR